MNNRNNITIYHYDDVFGEFLHVDEARPDPLDRDNYLIPANATTIAPPAFDESTETVLFDTQTQSWAVVPDHRGRKYWRADGSVIQIDRPGITPPADATETEPPPPLDEYIRQAQEIIDIAAGEARSRFVSRGELIDQEYQLAERDAAYYAANGGLVPATLQAWADITGQNPIDAAADILATADALYSAIAQIRAERLAGKQAVTTATDHAAVDAALALTTAALAAITPTTTGS